MVQLDLAAIGARIKKQRKALGYTQQYVYEKLDISQNHYSRIENGHTGMSVEILLQICSILRITANYILTGDVINNMHPDFAVKFNNLTHKQREYIKEQIDDLMKYDLK